MPESRAPQLLSRAPPADGRLHAGETSATSPRARPAGTVTFLFTDVAGSTQLWEQHAAWMEHAHSRHEAILRRAIAAHGGWTYKQIGDAFQAAFQTAADALAAAVAAQRALAAGDHPQGEGGALTLRVRMALHTGSTEERADDYFGPLLNRLARLLAVGHGGQILLTGSTRAWLQDALPPGVSLLDLGERRLKDLIRPEHIYQVQAVGLPGGFPPLLTIDTRPHNLPRQPAALIGREHEVAAVIRLLRTSEVVLVTLTGPGGSGKTRLSQQIAADLLDDFPDGVWFVELGALTDAALVPATIAATLRVAEQGGQPLLDTLQGWLRDKHLLLVLDNYEQVAAAAPVVAGLVAVAPGVKILVTSRAGLRLYGEHEFPVPPLAVPPAGTSEQMGIPGADLVAVLSAYDAVRLFVERARAVRPEFALTPESAGAVAAICARLDGLPLGIELAAAAVQLFAPAALLRRLDRRLAHLSRGAASRPLRQQTLRAAIDWSYALLAPAEQRLFRRLAVFHAGGTLDAIEDVCTLPGEGDTDILGSVETLLSQSLLVPPADSGDEPRFAMLETIAEYAREKLRASGEEDALRRAHARYFLALSEEAEPALRGPQQARWLARLEDEHDNLRAVLRWVQQARPGGAAADTDLACRLAGALWRFWLFRGYVREGYAWLQEMNADAGRVPAAIRAKLLHGLGILADALGEMARATAYYEESLLLRRQLGDRPGVAVLLNNLGNTALLQADFAGADRWLTEGMAFHEPADTWTGALLHSNLGYLALHQGRYPEALAHLTESLRLRRSAGDTKGIAESSRSLGIVAALDGDWPRARTLLTESLTLFGNLDNQDGIAGALDDLGLLDWYEGHTDRAAARWQVSFDLYQAIGNQAGVAGVRLHLARLQTQRGDPARGAELVRESLLVFRALGYRTTMTECLRLMAGIAGALKQPVRGARLFGAEEAQRVAMGSGLPPAEQGAYAKQVAFTRAQLHPQVWTTAWLEGGAMSLDEAATYALLGSVAGILH